MSSKGFALENKDKSRIFYFKNQLKEKKFHYNSHNKDGFSTSTTRKFFIFGVKLASRVFLIVHEVSKIWSFILNLKQEYDVLFNFNF